MNRRIKLLGFMIAVGFAPLQGMAQMVTLIDAGSNKMIQGEDVVITNGSPYLEEEFVPGKITTVEGKVYTDIQVRYDALNDQLQILQNNMPSILENKDIASFEMMIPRENGTLVRKFRTGLSEFSPIFLPHGFYEIVQEGAGKSTIVLKHAVQKLNLGRVGYNDTKQEVNYTGTTFNYLIAPGGKVREFKLKKKQVLKALGEAAEEVETFAEKNELDYKQLEDVIEMILFADSLQ